MDRSPSTPTTPPPSDAAPPARSANRRIFTAILTVGGLGVVTRLAVIARDLALAHRFGTRDELDAYLVAFTVPLFLVTVIAGSFNAALIPTLIEVRERDGRAAAQRLFSTVQVVTVALLGGVAALAGLLSPLLLPLLGSGFDAPKLALAGTLFLLLLPVPVLSGLSTIWSAVLNADERFALAAAAPFFTPLVPIAAITIAPDRFAIHALAAGTTAGYLVEATIVGAALARGGFSVLPRFHDFDAPARQVIRQYVPMVAGSLLMSSTTLVNQAMAGHLGPGSTSTLSYAGKIVSVATGLGAMSLSTAVLPHFSRMVARRDFAAVRHTMRTWTAIVLAGAVPLTAALMVLSPWIVRLVFQRGAFTAEDTALVARVQACFAIQIPFYLVGTLVVRLISSLKGNSVLLQGAVINLAVNVGGGLLAVRAFGVAGVALATSAVFAVSCIFLSFMCAALLRERSR